MHSVYRVCCHFIERRYFCAQKQEQRPRHINQVKVGGGNLLVMQFLNSHGRKTKLKT